MKKILSVSLTVLLVLLLTACGTQNTAVSDLSDTIAALSSDVASAAQSNDNASAAGESVFTTDKFDIILPDGYHEANNMIPAGSDIDVMISDARDNIGLLFIEEALTDFEGTQISSLDDYLQWQHDYCNGTDPSDILEANGVKYFTYTFLNTDLGYTYKYYTTVKSSDTAYWTIQGFCLQSQYDELEPDFMRWIDSVQFH